LQISRALAEHLLKRGAPIQALDLARDELGRHPADVRLQQLEGLALARIGAIQEANRVLRKLFDGGHLDPETMGALARTYKDMWEQEADPVKARGCLDQAHKLYHDVYDLTCKQREEDPDSALYTGVNAASTALLRGEGEEARRLALAVRTWCERRLARSSDYWAEATLGEVALILGDHPGAEEAYARAASKWRGNVGDQSRTRHQDRALLTHLGQNPHALDHCFTIGRVAVFAGHMVDQPNRAVPRFPPGLVPQVREAIRARLAELDIRVGFSSAACGADLLFLEALLGREGEAHVVLPCPLEHFRRDSVDITPDALWGERLTDVLRRAAHIEVASEQLATPGPATCDFANILLLGLAIMRARQLDTELVPLAVWNGQSGDGPGGTAAVVERWQNQGLYPIVIDLAEMLGTKARLPGAGQSAAVAQIRLKGPPPQPPRMR
jgi:tetratricopeptide (TPR) repeat protein